MSKIDIINQMIIDVFEEKSKLIQSLLSPTIGFKLKTKNSTSEFIKSKFGGVPNLPYNFTWPKYRDNPLSFLCQINLNDISNYNSILPKNGILYFFILTEMDGYRYPENENQFKVIYVDNIEKVNLENKEKNNSFLFKEYSLSFFEHYTFPSYQEYLMLKDNLNDDDLSDIDDIYLNISEITGQDSDEFTNQILGNPQALQGAVKFHWASKYLNCQSENFNDFEIEKLGKEGESFINLLQLDFSNNLIDFENFGNAIVYFGIHKNDLETKNFNNTKLVIQNT